jgi:hypothetical protein
VVGDRLEQEAERIQSELKRKRDRRKAAAERWYADHRERDEAGKRGAVSAIGGGGEAEEDEELENEDGEEDEEDEDELEEGYSREEWAQLRRVLATQGGDLLHDFQRELARKRQQDREERLREREEEVEEEEEEEDEDHDHEDQKK